jgi:vacuolar-type H+-ATPase subunit F/Vma7
MKPLSTSVCIVTMEIEPAFEDEVNRWYAEEHLPALLGVPGYLKAERFVAVDGAPKYMAYYELTSPAAYHSREHDVAVNTPWTLKLRGHFKSQIALYEQLPGGDGTLPGVSFDDWQTPIGGVMIMRSAVAPEHEEEFNRWYREEHLPGLMSAPGALFARRYKVVEGEPLYMARYDLTAPEVCTSPAWDAGAETPWTFAMREKYTARWKTTYVPLGAGVEASLGRLKA